MAMEKVNRFNILNEINVNEHVEQKNKLTYLSWAWAWQMFSSSRNRTTRFTRTSMAGTTSLMAGPAG